MVTKHIQTTENDHRRQALAVCEAADNQHYPLTTYGHDGYPLDAPLARQQDTTAVLSTCCKKGSTAVNYGTPRYRLFAGRCVSPGTVVRSKRCERLG